MARLLSTSYMIPFHRNMNKRPERKGFLVKLILFTFFLIPLHSHSQSKNHQDKIQGKLDSLCKIARYPGISMAIAYPEGEIVTYTSGYADTTAREKLSDNSFLLQGSVGKTYVAAITMRLIRSGRLSLEDKAARYLGNQPWFHRLPNANKINIRMLMQHTSGIMRYEFKPSFTSDLTAHPDKIWKPEELLAYVFDEKPTFDAGKGWDYADTNYIILGMILERITGKKYYTLLKEELLTPFKLKNTHPSDKRKLKGLVQGYAGNDNAFGNQSLMVEKNGDMIVSPQFEWTGGGIYSTSSDLARWCKILYEGKAFSTDLLPIMLSSVPAPMLGKNAAYGLGVIIKQSPTYGNYYGHSGFFPGYLTEMYYFPRFKTAIVVQTNTSDVKSIKKNPHQVLLEMAAEIFKSEQN